MSTTHKIEWDLHLFQFVSGIFVGAVYSGKLPREMCPIAATELADTLIQMNGKDEVPDPVFLEIWTVTLENAFPKVCQRIAELQRENAE